MLECGLLSCCQWEVQCQSEGDLCTAAGLGGAGGSQSLQVRVELRSSHGCGKLRVALLQESLQTGV